MLSCELKQKRVRGRHTLIQHREGQPEVRESRCYKKTAVRNQKCINTLKHRSAGTTLRIARSQ